MLQVWKGIQSLFDSYIHIDPLDYVLLIYTPDAQESATWVSAALEDRQIKYSRFVMQPLHDSHFDEQLAHHLPKPNDIKKRLIVLTFERDTMSHTTSLLNQMRHFPKDKIVALRTISASAELFSVALMPTPEELERRNAYIIDKLYGTKSLRVTTQGGTDIRITLDSEKHRWISNRGRLRPGATIILPAGEVATYPADVNGIFVADFAYNINMVTEKDVRLNHCPVRLDIENGLVKKYSCDNPEIQKFLDTSLSTECSFKIGELGFGTNMAVTYPVPFNSHVNERCPGIHLGLGQHNQNPDIVGYQCAIHLDLIAKGGLVWADGELVVDLENVPDSAIPHPTFTEDEDVFSPESIDDCCGNFQCKTA